MVYEIPSLYKYFKIKGIIKQRISNDIYPIGSKIPNEHQLSKEFNVNRLTVRRALTLLVQEGYLKRFQRRGTFILKKDKDLRELELQGFFGDYYSHVAELKTKKAQICKQKPPQNVTELFQLDPNKDKVKVIKRIRYDDNIPVALITTYLPMTIGNQITKRDLYQMPLLDILKKKIGIELGDALQTLEASIADEHVAEVLEISAGSQIFLIKRTLFTKQNEPVSFAQIFYRGDKIRYSIRFPLNEIGNKIV